MWPHTFLCITVPSNLSLQVSFSTSLRTLGTVSFTRVPQRWPLKALPLHKRSVCPPELRGSLQPSLRGRSCSLPASPSVHTWLIPEHTVSSLSPKLRKRQMCLSLTNGCLRESVNKRLPDSANIIPTGHQGCSSNIPGTLGLCFSRGAERWTREGSSMDLQTNGSEGAVPESPGSYSRNSA